MLRDFPENYTLWTHSRNVVTSKAKKEGKRRADAYLYGHPNGPSGRYRSPAEFLPHLMWLATDETADRNNCGCKLCFSDASLKTYFEISNKQIEHLDQKTKARVKKDRNEFLKDYEFDDEKNLNGEKGGSKTGLKKEVGVDNFSSLSYSLLDAMQETFPFSHSAGVCSLSLHRSYKIRAFKWLEHIVTHKMMFPLVKLWHIYLFDDWHPLSLALHTWLTCCRSKMTVSRAPKVHGLYYTTSSHHLTPCLNKS